MKDLSSASHYVNFAPHQIPNEKKLLTEDFFIEKDTMRLKATAIAASAALKGATDHGGMMVCRDTICPPGLSALNGICHNCADIVSNGGGIVCTGLQGDSKHFSDILPCEKAAFNFLSESSSLFSPQQDVPIAWEVLQTLQKSEKSAQACADHIEPIEEDLSELHERIETVTKVVDAIDRNSDKITKSIERTSNNVKRITDIAQRIPKLGKIIKIGGRIFVSAAGAMTKITKQIDTLKDGLDKLESAVGKAVDVSGTVKSKYETAADRMGKAAKVQDGVVRCVSATEGKSDDAALETTSGGIKGSVDTAYRAIDVCDQSFSKAKGAIDRALAAIKKLKTDTVKQAIDILEDKLGPVIEEFEKIIDKVTDTITEGYCCATPFPLQKLGELGAQVFDVVTCPIDGLLAEAEKALANVISAVSEEIYDLFTQQLQPVVKELRELRDNTALTITVIDKYSVEDACTLSQPKFVPTTYYLFDDSILRAFPSRMDSQAMVRFDLGSSIVNACKESASALGKVSTESCCVEFKGYIKKGDFCDPSDSVPYKHCSMCAGGDSSFWWSKGHQACGEETCLRDGVLCGIGTTCNSCCAKKSEYWYSKVLTACGKEPCWKDGASCALGTSCNRCCKSATYWPGKAFTACGKEPCWGKGTKCGEGTTCKQCCKGASYTFPNLWSNCK